MFTGDDKLTAIRREVSSDIGALVKEFARSSDPEQWLELLDDIILEARDAKTDISVAREI